MGKAGSCGWPAWILGKSWAWLQAVWGTSSGAAIALGEAESGRIYLKRTNQPLGQSILTVSLTLSQEGEDPGNCGI